MMLFINGKLELLSDARDSAAWLQKELGFMQAFIRDSEERQEGDHFLQHLKSTIEDIAGETVSVLEEFERTAADDYVGLDLKTRLWKGIRHITTFRRKQQNMFDIGDRILKLKERVEDIPRIRQTYEITISGRGRGGEQRRVSLESTTSYTEPRHPDTELEDRDPDQNMYRMLAKETLDLLNITEDVNAVSSSWDQHIFRDFSRLPAAEEVNSTVHTGITCDYCETVPIVGVRYKCEDCLEDGGFDLCEECYSSGLVSNHIGLHNDQKHNSGHKFAILTSNVNAVNTTVHNIICDYCEMYPIVGVRYKCKDCLEVGGFDLCEECYSSGLVSNHPGLRKIKKHTSKHKFAILTSNVDHDHIDVVM